MGQVFTSKFLDYNILRQLFSFTKYNYLEIKFNNRNQVEDKMAWGLGGEFLY